MYITLSLSRMHTGAQNAIRLSLHPVIAVLCGMFTATFGGVIRDVLCRRPVRILHSHAEVYASTALVGASVYTAVRGIGAPPSVRILLGVGSAMGCRYAADRDHITLPQADWFKGK